MKKYSAFLFMLITIFVCCLSSVFPQDTEKIENSDAQNKANIKTFLVYQDSLDQESALSATWRNRSFFGSLAGFAVSGVLHMLANSTYDDYQHASTSQDAQNYWNQTKSLDQLSNIFSGISIGLLAGSGYFQIKKIIQQDKKTDIPLVYNKIVADSLSRYFNYLDTCSDGIAILATKIISNNINNIVISKIDNNANELWSFTYGDSSLLVGRGFTQTVDGCYLALLEKLYDYGQKSEVSCIKIDSTGTVLWQYSFSDNVRYYSISLLNSNQSQYVIMASYTSSMDSDSKVRMIRLDNEGTEQNNKTIDISGLCYIKSGCINSDGDIYLTGLKVSNDLNLNSQNRMNIIKLTKGLDITWEKEYKDINLNELAEEVINPTHDNGSIILGTSRVSSSVMGRLFLTKLDSSGQIQWQKYYGEISPGEKYDITTIHDHGYIFVTTDNFNIKVNITDHEGFISFQQTYESKPEERALQIAELRDGSFLVLGSGTNVLNKGLNYLVLLRTYSFLGLENRR